MLKTSGISKFILFTVQYDNTDASFLKIWSVSCLGVLFLFYLSIVPQILVVGLVHLVAETVVNIVGLIVRQLLFQFVV